MIRQHVEKFLKKHYQNGQPLILALSGGPDSLLLFYLLKELHPIFHFDLHVVHIDHSWRSSSRAEAKQVEGIVKESPFAFHPFTLPKPETTKNIEARYREKRLKIFNKLARELRAQAVILGHHADDQAETVLKRLFEGAFLWKCRGMGEVAVQEGTTFWRPLLKIPKRRVLKWLEARGIVWIDDKTNYESTYLRGRLRGEVIPSLSEMFQKEIAGPLVQVGAQIEAVNAYFNEKIQPDSYTSIFGNAYDLSGDAYSHPVEVEYALKKILDREKLIPSREVLHSCTSKVLEGSADCAFFASGKKLIIDRRWVFFPAEEIEYLPDQPIQLGADSRQFGIWNIDIGHHLEEERGGWRQTWLGRAGASLPEGKYFLAAPSSRMPVSTRVTLDKWFCQNKVPSFFRQKVPVVLSEEGRVIHEFLTGKAISDRDEEGLTILISC